VVFGGVRDWTKVFASTRQALYPLSHTPRPFCLRLFFRWNHAFCTGTAGLEPPQSFYLPLPRVAGITGVGHNTQSRHFLTEKIKGKIKTLMQTQTALITIDSLVYNLEIPCYFIYTTLIQCISNVDFG
jgi:hypothetical protein